MAATESNQRSVSLKNPALPFRGDSQRYPYSHQHPLYRALKALGQIIKSIFLLCYIDDHTLRQAIEKQLNKLESANKFSRAVFYGNNQEFQQETGSESDFIECEIPEEIIHVKGDEEALAQALWNLLDNAVKYSEKGKNIYVKVEAGNPVSLKVRDQGLGIPASERSRIFRKFVRGANTKAQGVKGTGIGLAVVKHIVDAHGGEIQVESEPGKGSTFTIKLPSGG